jgi:hypothetical protein
VWCLLSFGYRNAFDARNIMLSLNVYFDKCLKIIVTFDDFTIQHISRNENTVMNNLAQEAPGFRSNRGKLYVLRKLDVSICHSGCSGLQPMHRAKICSTEPNLTKLDVPKSETGGSGISRSSDDLAKQWQLNLRI